MIPPAPGAPPPARSRRRALSRPFLRVAPRGEAGDTATGASCRSSLLAHLVQLVGPIERVVAFQREKLSCLRPSSTSCSMSQDATGSTEYHGQRVSSEWQSKHARRRIDRTGAGTSARAFKAAPLSSGMSRWRLCDRAADPMTRIASTTASTLPRRTTPSFTDARQLTARHTVRDWSRCGC